MYRPKVLIAKEIPDYVEEFIGKHCDYEIFHYDDVQDREGVLGRLHDKEGMIEAGIKIDEELLDKAPHLKMVSNISVGYDNYDIEAMKKRDVVGTHTPYVLNDTMADLVFGLMLALARKIPQLDAHVKAGKWDLVDDPFFFGKEVHHMTLGIIGMGRIGLTVARRAKSGFDMEVLYHNRTRNLEAEEELGVKYSEFDELLKKSDYIVVLTSLHDGSYHLIDASAFDKMKKDAYFINVSRGATVDEKALIEALREEKILGAGLDVFEQEPIAKDNPLLDFPQVIALPHIGTATEKTNNDMAMLAAENMVNYLLGLSSNNIVPELQTP